MATTLEPLTRLETYLGDRYSSHTIRAYTRQGAQFLAMAGDKPHYSRDDVLGVVNSMVAHYGTRSIETMIAGIRALFRANQWPWPLERRDLHLPAPVAVSAPVATGDAIANLIAASLVRGPGYETAAVALSTVFGLRNTEIAASISAGCNGEQFVLQTAKGGRQRDHRIPNGLRPYLTFKAHAIGLDGAHGMFERAMGDTGRKPEYGEGWHSVRRALVTALVNHGLDQYSVSRWMGWRLNDTAFRYFRPDPVELDVKIYSRHPWLPLWLVPHQ